MQRQPEAENPSRDIIERSLICSVGNRSVPVAMWLPSGLTHRPLLLVGHGGSGDKRSDFVTDIAERLVRQHGFVVAAIDGPVHGERRQTPATPLQVRTEFRELWDQGGSVDPMIDDWNEVMSCLCGFQEVDASRVGYYGVSMGTAYGLPFLAQRPEVRAAVLGMWGTSRVHGERLARDASQVNVPVLFSIQWHDEIFTREGQFELFDALACSEKSMTIHPGKHVNPDAARLDEVELFLVRHLAPAA